MSEISKRMIMIMDIYRWVVALGGGATGAHFFIQQTFSIKFERAHPHPPPPTPKFPKPMLCACFYSAHVRSQDQVRIELNYME